MVGKVFKISVFGESHGKCVGVLIEGCPPGIKIDPVEIRKDLEKRKPGENFLSSSRKEKDEFEIFSGVFKGFTTGVPITIIIWNKDVDSTFYEKFKDIPRPGHADYTARIKYFSFNDYRGGGVFSGRITAALVAAGVVAKKLLKKFGIEVIAYVSQIGNIKMSKELSMEEIRANIEKSSVRCPDLEASERMVKLVKKIRAEGDSIGGIIEAIAFNVPVGLGEPIFDNLEGEIAKAMFSIPAIKGIEFGTGFKLAEMKGSEANDQFAIKNGKVTTLTNNSGGILGGISNGAPIKFKLVVKPTPSIFKTQNSINLKEMKETILRLEGRFDPCIAVRAVPVVESMFAVVLADHLLRWLSWIGFKNFDAK